MAASEARCHERGDSPESRPGQLRGFARNCLRQEIKRRFSFEVLSFFLHLRLQLEVRKWDRRASPARTHPLASGAGAAGPQHAARAGARGRAQPSPWGGSRASGGGRALSPWTSGSLQSHSEGLVSRPEQSRDSQEPQVRQRRAFPVAAARECQPRPLVKQRRFLKFSDLCFCLHKRL